ncbi:MAG: phosphatase PAP2 family protein [Chloroflexi bacterium]|nr:phosphatase PAP2 family protein [Chloroflexota bacterium]
MLSQRLWSRRADIAFAIGWLSMLAAFVVLAVWNTRRYALPFDPAPTRWVEDLDRFAWAGPLFSFANRAGQYEVIGTVLVAWCVLLLLRGFRFEALIVAGAGAMSGVQVAVRELVQRPFSLENPPWFQYPGWDLRQFPGADGFPSGHVFGEVIVYGLVFAYAVRVFRWRIIAWPVRLACVALIAIGAPARLYTGAHWPSDVIGSVLLAGLYLAFAWRVDAAVRRIRAVARERALARAAGIVAAAPPSPADAPRPAQKPAAPARR